LKTVIERADHAALATGTFSCGALSKDPMLIVRGEVQFFTPDEEVSDATSLVYKLTLLTTDGQTYLFNGYNVIGAGLSSSFSSSWTAATTLSSCITRLDGSLVGRGRLHLSWRNFASELKGFRPTGSGDLLTTTVLPPLQFWNYFARNIAQFLFRPLSRLQYPDQTHSGYTPKVAAQRIDTLTASDGVQTTTKVWAPDPRFKGDKKALPVLMIPGVSVDDQVFSLPTIPTNAVEYFTARGYTVYVHTPRFGRTPAAKKGYTVYDARLDIAAAMKFVHDQFPGKMYIICHCAGAIATSMGLLDGTLPPEWIQGLTASQVFFTQHFGTINALKARTSLLPNILKVRFSLIYLHLY
jgi:hypothetical protein